MLNELYEKGLKVQRNPDYTTLQGSIVMLNELYEKD